jgi:hypothetical protein
MVDNNKIYFDRLICIGLGAISWPMGFIAKFIKEELCFQFGSKEANPLNNGSKVIAIKGAHS